MNRTIAVIIMAMFVLTQGAPAFALRSKEVADDGQDEGVAATIEAFLNTGPVVASDELRSDIRHGGVAAPAAATGKTVLIAEDSDKQRERLERILQREGYNVIAAKDGQEALDILNSGVSVDLIISDNQMPRLDGLTLEMDRPRREVPFIVVSVDKISDYLLRIYNVTVAVQKAARDYEENLIATVKNIFNGQQRVQDGAAVVISQEAVVDLGRIRQEVKPFGIEFKDVVRVSSVDEIEKISDPIVVILNDTGDALTEVILSYAEQNKIGIVDMRGKKPSKVTKEIEQAV